MFGTRLRTHVRFSLSAAASAATLTLALTAAPAMADTAPVAVPASTCVNAAGIQIACVTPPAAPTGAAPAPGTADGTCADSGLEPSAGNMSRVNLSVLCLLNQQRKQHHLTKFTQQKTLSLVAKSFAGQLVHEHFFDHTAPNGRTMLDRIKATSYLTGTIRSWSVGENIAYGTDSLSTPGSIVKAWMASPEHRANILDPRFREIGLGVSLGSPTSSTGATYVNDFGQRTR